MKIQKTVSEVRFIGQLSIIENMNKAIRRFFPSDFPYWRIETNSSFRLFNSEQLEKATEVLFIDASRFIYSVENPSTENYFTEKLQKYCKLFSEFIETDQIARVGIRTIKLFKQENKKSTLSNFEAMYNTDFLRGLSDQSPSDYFNVIEYENQRITVGPLAKKESNQYLNEFVEKDRFFDNMLLVDIDSFRKEITKKNLQRVISELSVNNFQTAAKTESYFLKDN